MSSMTLLLHLDVAGVSSPWPRREHRKGPRQRRRLCVTLCHGAERLHVANPGHRPVLPLKSAHDPQTSSRYVVQRAVSIDPLALLAADAGARARY